MADDNDVVCVSSDIDSTELIDEDNGMDNVQQV